MTELSQRLADVHTDALMYFVIVLTVIRLVLVKRESPTSRAVVEIADAALFAAVLMFMIVLPFVVKSFYIPSGSMRPTLIDDDHILVNKFEYRFHEPSHKDVVVFTAPPEALKTAAESAEPDGSPTDYIKRLVGLPGDVVTVTAGLIKIGPPGAQQIKTHEDIRNAFGILDADRQHVKFTKNGVNIDDGTGKWTTLTPDEIGEKLGFTGQQIEIDPGQVYVNGAPVAEPYVAEDPDYDLKLFHGGALIRDDQGERLNSMIYEGGPNHFDRVTPEAVPAGHVIVFGDNRNDSNDCSRWGPLDETRLVGRAFLIFYPFDRMRMIK